MKRRILSLILICFMSTLLFGTYLVPVLAETSDDGQEEFAIEDAAQIEEEEEFALAEENEEIIDLDETEGIIDLDHPDESDSPASADEVKTDETEDSSKPKIKDGPADIWEAIYALEESAGVSTPDEYKELLPQIEKIILSSPAYEEGTMEYEDGILFWWSDCRLNGYSADARAEMNGYTAMEGTSPELEALYEETIQQMEEDTEEEMEIRSAQAGTQETETDIAVFLPYSVYSGA